MQLFKIVAFLLFFIGSAVKGNEEKLAEVFLSSDDLSCANETTLKNLAQVVCKSVPRTSFSLLNGVLFGSIVSFGISFLVGQYFTFISANSVEEEERNEVDLTVVENVTQTQLRPSRLAHTNYFQIVNLPSVEIQPERKSARSATELDVDETEGKPSDKETTPFGECLEPEIILEDSGDQAEIGERPQDKINERKPMIFVGGVSASTTPIELVSEFRKQGFNVTVLPRIRYGVSFGFCPDLVLSSIEEIEELLALERVWVKDRWVDVRPYIPKDCPAAVASQHRDETKEEKENVEYINVEDLLNTTPSLQETWKPLGSPIHFGQPYIYPLGSPIYVSQCHGIYPQHSPELPFLNSHAMRTLDTFHQQPVSHSNSMQTYSSQ